MAKASQKQRLLAYMKENGGITSLEAIQKLHIVSLSRRICDLKQMGIKIDKEIIVGRNYYNEPVCYTRYSLGKEEEQCHTTK